MDSVVVTSEDCLENSAISFAADCLKIPLKWQYTKSQHQERSTHSKGNALSKYPALVTPEGTYFSSNAIVRYLARRGKKMYGKSLHEHTEIDQWLQFSGCQLRPLTTTLVRTILGKDKITKRIYNLYLSHLHQMMTQLTQALQVRQWLVGSSVTIADIVLLCDLEPAFSHLFDEQFRQKHPYLVAWFISLSHMPEFVNVFGSCSMCVKAAEPKEYLWEPEDRLEVRVVKTQQHPAIATATLDPSLDFIEKVRYLFRSHSDRRVAMEEFWAHFQPTKYCLFRSTYYNYNNQCREQLEAINLREDLVSSLTKNKINAFGVIGVYELNGTLHIVGMWLFEGQQIPNEWQQHPLFHYNDFYRVDPKNDASRLQVAEFWTNTESGSQVGGYKVISARYYM